MAVVEGLRLRQPLVDFRTAVEVGTLGMLDPAVLAFAAWHDRILVSHDKRTLPTHFAEFRVAGHQSPGVMLLSRKLSIRHAIEALLLVWDASRHD